MPRFRTTLFRTRTYEIPYGRGTSTTQSIIRGQVARPPLPCASRTLDLLSMGGLTSRRRLELLVLILMRPNLSRARQGFRSASAPEAHSVSRERDSSNRGYPASDRPLGSWQRSRLCGHAATINKPPTSNPQSHLRLQLTPSPKQITTYG